MTDTTSFPTSNKARKLAQDVQFATSIGRDSPFDPFHTRDITLLFSEKKEPSTALLNFAQKPERRTMPTSIVFAKMPGREPVQSPFKNHAIIEPTATTYSPQLQPKGPHPQIAFPKAKRELLSHLGETDVLAKYERPKNGSPEAGSASLDATAMAGMHTSVEELMSCRQRAKLRSVSRPVSQMSMRPGVSIGKGGLRDTGSATGTKRQAASDYKMPWEIAAREAAKAKALRAAAASSQMSASLRKSPLKGLPQALHDDDGDGIDLSMSQDENNAAQLDSSNLEGPKDTSVMQGEEDEEEWLRRRMHLLSRFGLIGGTNANDRRGGAPRGLDFGARPSRSAPIGFHQPQKEINDNPYVPQDRVTTKTRAVAHVELGKQASRFTKDDTLMTHLNSLLNYERLAKLHQRMREEERKALTGLTASSAMNDGKSGHGGGSPLDRPLSAADELAYNYDSLKPPMSRRHVPHTSDAFLWATRADEPLAAVLGGDPKPYRRAAMKAVAQETSTRRSVQSTL
jgi:hypothetical protein